MRTPAGNDGSGGTRGPAAAEPAAAPGVGPDGAFAALAPLLSAAGCDLLRRHARPFEAAPSILHQEGDPCAAVSLLATGRLRVARRHPSGREITLYVVEPGGLCALEVLAVLAEGPYAAEAVVDEAATGVLIPATVLRELVASEPGLRAALFRLIHERMAHTLDLVGDIALGRLETRLAVAVLQHVGPGDVAMVTHERLARDVACAREAVSRTVGGWERAGIVRLGRGSLTVLDPGRLAALAHADPRGSAAAPAPGRPGQPGPSGSPVAGSR